MPRFLHAAHAALAAFSSCRAFSMLRLLHAAHAAPCSCRTLFMPRTPRLSCRALFMPRLFVAAPSSCCASSCRAIFMPRLTRAPPLHTALASCRAFFMPRQFMPRHFMPRQFMPRLVRAALASCRASFHAAPYSHATPLFVPCSSSSRRTSFIPRPNADCSVLLFPSSRLSSSPLPSSRLHPLLPPSYSPPAFIRSFIIRSSRLRHPLLPPSSPRKRPCDALPRAALRRALFFRFVSPLRAPLRFSSAPPRAAHFISIPRRALQRANEDVAPRLVLERAQLPRYAAARARDARGKRESASGGENAARAAQS